MVRLRRAPIEWPLAAGLLFPVSFTVLIHVLDLLVMAVGVLTLRSATARRCMVGSPHRH